MSYLFKTFFFGFLILIFQASVPRYENASVFIGEASYYHSKYIGKKTASGQIYDPNKLTAAHKSLPFGTKVRVVNLENNKAVIVTINDRMPRYNSRLIDLSYAAARKLDMLKKGTVRVKIEIIKRK